MVTITIQDLQDIAVKCTSEFLNSGTSLNASLAKEASSRGLNSDQLQRAIEATNTLTHLKSIELSKDRTVEFPVADYREIIKSASIPDSLLNGQAPVMLAAGEGVEKQASQSSQVGSFEYFFPELNDAEKRVWLMKEASINARKIEDLNAEFIVLTHDLVKQANVLRKDPELLEHLSASSLSDEDFTKIAGMLLIPGVARKDFAKATGMFKSASLGPVETFVGMFKRAENVNSELKARRDLAEKAEALKNPFIKEAGLLGAAKSVIGSVSSNGVMKSIGIAAGKTISYIPRKIGAAVTTGAKEVGVALRNKVETTTVAKKFGVTPVPVNQSFRDKAKAVATTVPMVAGAAMDASMFKPTVNPAKDRSGAVWDALQG